MTSALLGLIAALSWGTATICLARASRLTSLRAFGAWFLLLQAVILLPAVAARHGALEWSLAGVGLAALAAVTEAGGILVYGLALRRGDLAVVAPLVALEGVFAAVFSIAGGEPVSALVLLGLGAAAAGGLVVSTRGRVTVTVAGSGLATLTAAIFGLGLWLVAEAELDELLTLLVFNGGGAILIALLTRGGARELRRVPWASLPLLVLAALASTIGFVSYAVGARSGSVAITAVLSAQFSVVAVIGGHVLLGERIERRQLLGMLIVMAGVSTVAVSVS